MGKKTVFLSVLVFLFCFCGQVFGGFADRRVELGLGGMNTGAAAWGDFNNDGYPDLYDSSRLWVNNNGTSFTAISGYGWGIWGDYDNDGYLDIFILSGSSVVKRNLAGTGFTTVALPALPTTDNRGASWADFDNDGYIDLYVGGYESGGYQPDAILSNSQGTAFVKTWQEPPVPPDYVVFPGRGVTACDFDEDGDQDVYVSNYRLEANYLWLNDGNGVITDVAQAYGVAGTYDGWRWSYGHSIGSAWGDFDNDGHIDLFAGNFSHADAWQDRARFYRNLGPGGNWHFAQMWEMTGSAWQEAYATPAVGDYDNDGDLDLFFTTAPGDPYVGSHPRLWRNDGNWNFTNVTSLEGLGSVLQSYQAAWADIDNDGDLDLATGGGMYVNSGNANHWLKVHLSGDGIIVNRAAIGVQARIDLGGGTILTRQVEGGTGEANQNELTLHFGLGDHSGPVDLEILWTDGNVQNITTPIDRCIEVQFDSTPYCGDYNHPYPPGDLNKDCHVDFNDFAILGGTWGDCTSPECVGSSSSSNDVSIEADNETWMYKAQPTYPFNSTGDPYDDLQVGNIHGLNNQVAAAAVQLDLSAYAGGTAVGDGTLSFYSKLQNGHSEQYPPYDAWWIHELTKDYEVTEATWNEAAAGDAWTPSGGNYWDLAGCGDRGTLVGTYRVEFDNTDWTLKTITVDQALLQSWLGDDTVSLHFGIHPDYYWSFFAYKATYVAGNGAGSPAGPTLTFTPTADTVSVEGENENWTFKNAPDWTVGSPSYNNGMLDVLQVGNEHGLNNIIYGGMVQLDLSDLAGKVVTGDGALTFKAKLGGGDRISQPGGFDVTELTKDYIQGEACWNNAATGDPWTNTGETFWDKTGCGDTGTVVGNFTVADGEFDWVQKTIVVDQALIQSWVDEADTVSLLFAVQPGYYGAYHYIKDIRIGASDPAGPGNLKLTFGAITPAVCGDETHPYPIGDIDENCVTDMLDIKKMAQYWLSCTAPECD